MDGTMSSPTSFSNLGDKLSGPEDLFDFSSLTVLHAYSPRRDLNLR